MTDFKSRILKLLNLENQTTKKKTPAKPHDALL